MTVTHQTARSNRDDVLDEGQPSVLHPLDSDRLPAPDSLEATGLSAPYISDLIVKHLRRFGVLTGLDLAEKLCLPFSIIDSLLDELVTGAYAEKRGGQGLGNSTDRFALTERGRGLAHDLLELDTYTGPAPITLKQYWRYTQERNLQSIKVTEPLLRETWRDFIVDEKLFTQIGPAIRSGKSCFLYGPPGTGKTTFAKKVAEFFDRSGGHTAVPHAILAGGNIIRVFDPVHHEPISDNQPDSADRVFKDQGEDRRWVLCRRPAVIVGGELELSMLDLRYNESTKFYEAPLQIKANGGVLIIDDFGRQLVKPKDLLNRWIVPLEERLDYMTLHTGKKFSVPFEQLVIFATNLNPEELVDEAFLRRIRYKIFIGETVFEVYRKIFLTECRKKGLEIGESDVENLVRDCYKPIDFFLVSWYTVFFTDQVLDYCLFNELPLSIPYDLLKQITSANLTNVIERQ